MADITRIVIIGGGASGTISAIHLLHEFKGPVRIYLIEKRQEALFRGAAYSSKLEFELLNVPVGKMSIFSDLPDDFYEWLLSNRQKLSKQPITREAFVSRRWFGDYLTERLVEAKMSAPKAFIEVAVAEATDILFDKQINAYKVRLSHGSLLEADKLIFATGHEPPKEIFSNLDKALLGRRYVENPWGTKPFENLSPQDDVLIIGSGLSMIDHALSLYKAGHLGRVYSFSRHALLPLAQHIGADGEVDLHDESPELFPVLNKLRAAAVAARQRGVPWQQVINSVRDDTRFIWQCMSVQSKRIFLRRLRVYWEIHRHRMPLESAELVSEMKSTGKLELLAGKYREISTGKHGFLFRFVSRVTGGLRSVKVNYVINCTGPSGNYNQCNNWMIRHMLSKGWMKEDELKLGIVTGYNGEIVTASGSALPNAYAIGPLRKASEWESTAIREIKVQAEQLALDIALEYQEPGLQKRVCRLV